MANRLFVISGPSGAGKGTLVKELMSARKDLWLSVSATTRAPREGEVDGEAYFFLSDEEFSAKIEQGGFLEWANVHEKRYGTLKSSVVDRLESGFNVLLEIDPQGALIVKENYPEAYLIFIKPPTFEDLEKRLNGRGTETAEQIAVRLENARTELAFEGRYDVTIINDEIPRATAELLAVIESQTKQQ